MPPCTNCSSRHPAWQAFIGNAKLSYSAQADHLLGREDSPFWDDRGTPQKEDKPAILARSLAAAVDAGTTQLGADRRAWQWGKLHQYRWPAPAYHGLGDKLERAPLAAGSYHREFYALSQYMQGMLDLLDLGAMQQINQPVHLRPINAKPSGHFGLGHVLRDHGVPQRRLGRGQRRQPDNGLG
ncbi:hypothetical protein WR25_18306 [Diploscapter pachys]|uniref:Uncharacterized protein n=1 Tax=Diploscapter pachys TaxID=2018661 RepID=A0A2A2K2P0_9BILA|nr:hypothetical protein WR25_18306 [Diploscapter pachys]